MALEHADEALHLLVDALASRPGSVRERLRDAWANHGDALKAEDLPEENREDLDLIRQAMNGRWPTEAGPDARDEPEPQALTDEQAAAVASTIARLSREVAFAFGRSDEREWPLPDGYAQ
jgi:hypothetical protein